MVSRRRARAAPFLRRPARGDPAGPGRRLRAPPAGRILRSTYGFEGAEPDVRSAGLILAPSLSPAAARITSWPASARATASPTAMAFTPTIPGPTTAASPDRLDGTNPCTTRRAAMCYDGTRPDGQSGHLHCHSSSVAVAKLAVQNALGLPECATPPEEVYALAKRRGMDFVTITDHDTIDGVLAIADRPDVFVSEELTAPFRGEPQHVHVLCLGITPATTTGSRRTATTSRSSPPTCTSTRSRARSRTRSTPLPRR